MKTKPIIIYYFLVIFLLATLSACSPLTSTNHDNCDVPKKEAATRLAELTGAALVQLIGKTIILYLPNKDLKPDQHISLPR
jgi:hypothetical protein